MRSVHSRLPYRSFSEVAGYGSSSCIADADFAGETETHRNGRHIGHPVSLRPEKASTLDHRVLFRSDKRVLDGHRSRVRLQGN